MDIKEINYVVVAIVSYIAFLVYIARAEVNKINIHACIAI